VAPTAAKQQNTKNLDQRRALSTSTPRMAHVSNSRDVPSWGCFGGSSETFYHNDAAGRRLLPRRVHYDRACRIAGASPAAVMGWGLAASASAEPLTHKVLSVDIAVAIAKTAIDTCKVQCSRTIRRRVARLGVCADCEANQSYLDVRPHGGSS
jgi:hypothetical protein